MIRKSWFFEGYISSSVTLSRVSLNQFPFQIGRQEDLNFSISSTTVSRVHAELLQIDGELLLTDYGSTNGTFVNKNRLTPNDPVSIQHGDVIHFGECEVRLIETQEDDSVTDLSQTVISTDTLTEKLPSGYRELSELIEKRLATAHYQPIVAADDNSIHAYEILGRGDHSGLSSSPGPLFNIAESYDCAVELSELFRDIGVQRAAQLNPAMRFFLNIHPFEHYDNDRMIEQLTQLRSDFPDLPLVMEVHEESSPNIDELQKLIGEIRRLNIEVAYDDFGAGQARLLELIEAPADYLKFDIAMVRNIHQAPDVKKQMIEALIKQAKTVGTKTLAEGLEHPEEAKTCAELGFDYFQGYLFGKPSADLNENDS